MDVREKVVVASTLGLLCSDRGRVSFKRLRSGAIADTNGVTGTRRRSGSKMALAKYASMGTAE